MKAWCLGNTTVRSPFRLREGLIALSTSKLQGDLHGQKQEIALCKLLAQNGIVESRGDKSYSVGRKWRSALSKLGFLYPEFKQSAEVPQKKLGPKDVITPSGKRLIKSETVPAIQECFLRSLAAYYIPSAVEKNYHFPEFSPLRHTLRVMLELEKQTESSKLHFLEMALILQLTNSEQNISLIVKQILSLRTARDNAQNKRVFDNKEHQKAAGIHPYKEKTFDDYADLNIRYLKASGLVQNAGRGITLVPEKHILIEKLISNDQIPKDNLSYFVNLSNGAILPTDNRENALAVLTDVVKRLKARDINFIVEFNTLNDTADINAIRHQVEELLSESKEEDFAKIQATKWKEIIAYMQIIMSNRNTISLDDGSEINVPRSEKPAYLEWIVWRAFLAIDSLTNKPYLARRFKIDQDFLPIGTAPGNGPDLIFEFEKFAVVVEVTLTQNSRQEALEGESVRRHTYGISRKLSEDAEKPVYGLFIANAIDSNTAETFRNGVWYEGETRKPRLNIVPIDLEQFTTFFKAIMSTRNKDVSQIKVFLDLCCESRDNYEAVGWKQNIGNVLNERIDIIESIQP